MKRLIGLIVLIIFSLILFSCSNTNQEHRIKFQIEFFESPLNGTGDFIDVISKPNYVSDEPVINKEYCQPGYVWTYEYWELKSGDQVYFSVMPQTAYHFMMSLYIDDELVSYKMITTGVGSYYVTSCSDWGGIGTEGTYWGVNDAKIVFTFNP